MLLPRGLSFFLVHLWNFCNHTSFPMLKSPIIMRVFLLINAPQNLLTLFTHSGKHAMFGSRCYNCSLLQHPWTLLAWFHYRKGRGELCTECSDLSSCAVSCPWLYVYILSFTPSCPTCNSIASSLIPWPLVPSHCTLAIGWYWSLAYVPCAPC